MEQKALATIREKLLENREGILHIIEREEWEKIIIVKSKIVNGDRVDEANMISEMEVYNRLEEMEREKLHRIDQTLERIEEGIYGRCVVCGGEIDERRLLAIPEARMCVCCQTEQEKMRVSMGSVHGKSFSQCLSGNENRNYTTENKIKN